MTKQDKPQGRDNVWAAICIAIALGGIVSSVSAGLHGYKLGQELEHERVRGYLTASHDKCWATVEDAKASDTKEVAERLALTCLGEFNTILGFPSKNHHDRGY